MIRARWILLIAVALATAAMMSGVANDTQAGRLAKAVMADDLAGRATTADLAELQAFVASHMGTSQAVYLDKTYQADTKVAQAAAAGSVAAGQVYASAQAACAGHADSIAQARCVTAFVAAHSTPGTGPKPVALPDRNHYLYTYISPAWTPDATGLGLVFAIVVAITALGWAIFRRRLP